MSSIHTYSSQLCPSKESRSSHSSVEMSIPSNQILFVYIILRYNGSDLLGELIDFLEEIEWNLLRITGLDTFHQPRTIWGECMYELLTTNMLSSWSRGPGQGANSICCKCVLVIPWNPGTRVLFTGQLTQGTNRGSILTFPQPFPGNESTVEQVGPRGYYRMDITRISRKIKEINST